MKWYWAATGACAVFCASGSLMLLLVLGVDFSTGPLYYAVDAVYQALSGVFPDTVASHLLIIAIALPAFSAGLATYAFLTRRLRDEYLRCPKCDHILKGLSEPRCPECGERI